MDYTEELFADINPEFVALFLQGGGGDCMYPYPDNYAGMLSQARDVADSIYRWVSDIENKTSNAGSRGSVSVGTNRNYGFENRDYGVFGTLRGTVQ